MNTANTNYPNQFTVTSSADRLIQDHMSFRTALDLWGIYDDRAEAQALQDMLEPALIKALEMNKSRLAS